MSFTYDVATDRGKVRMLIADVDSTNYTFNDAEIDALITMQPANLYCAAAVACETQGRAWNRLSASVRASDGSSVARRSAAEWLSLAKSLREAALSGGLVTDTISVATPGELLDSYRPEWRGINDLPVVE